MGRQEAQDSGFINGCLKKRKRGAPLKIVPQTTTNNKRKGKKTTAYPSLAVMVYPVTASTPVASSTTAFNTASTNGGATVPPSKSKRSRKHSGDTSKNTRAPYSKPAPKPTTRKSKYNNWKAEPFKSALACAFEAKLKGLDPQLASGYIILPGGTIQDRIKSVKAEAEKLVVSSLLYLKDLCHTEKTKMLTSGLDRDYIQ